MTTEIAEMTEERLAAFVAMFKKLPAKARQLLEAQATVFREQEIRHSEDVARVSKEKVLLISANTAAAEENAKLRHEIESIGAESAGLRKELVALRMECATLREERKGIEILEAAVEQYRAGRRAAEAAMCASEQAAADAPSDLAPACEAPGSEEMSRSGAESHEPETMVLPDHVELVTSNDAEVEAVFRLPSDLLAKADEGIQAGRWISRDAFARIAFAEAIGTHATKTTGSGKPVNCAASKRHLEGAGRDVTVRD